MVTTRTTKTKKSEPKKKAAPKKAAPKKAAPKKASAKKAAPKKAAPKKAPVVQQEAPKWQRRLIHLVSNFGPASIVFVEEERYKFALESIKHGQSQKGGRNPILHKVENSYGDKIVFHTVNSFTIEEL